MAKSKKSNKSKVVKQVRLRCANYQVFGDEFSIPVACLDCNQKGLVLAYNHKDLRLEAICSAREDRYGRFIKGCEKVSFAVPMTLAQFNVIADDPHTTDYFFCLKILSM